MKYQRNILKSYYNLSYEYLKEYLPYKPELKLTNAKSYYGKIYYNQGENGIICLSKFNLDMYIEWIDQEDIEEIIDTICHEFAHLYYRIHGTNHKNLTESFKNIVLGYLKLEQII